MNKIVIVGAGNIGSRHLQGLKESVLDLDITIIDFNELNLARAKERWDIAKSNTQSKKLLRLAPALARVNGEIDVLINATGASGRHRIIEEAQKRLSIRYFLIEKVLAQSSWELQRMVSLLSENQKAWVNTPRRSLPWYRAIREYIGTNRNTILEVTGNNWGLACNSVHFLDTLAWMTKESPVSVDTQGLHPKWLPSKREGYWEVFGKIVVGYDSGSHCILNCVDTNGRISKYQVEVKSGSMNFGIDEQLGVATFNDGYKIRGEIPMQSNHTGVVIDEILRTDTCGLPTLRESAKIHSVFIDGLLDHWRLHMDITSVVVPIT